MKITYIDSSKARAEFFAIIKDVSEKKKVYVVKKDGVPLIRIASYKEKPEKSFAKYKGIISDKEADKMLELVRSGRDDGSKKKKYLLKW